jgi:hypothetical protein
VGVVNMHMCVCMCVWCGVWVGVVWCVGGCGVGVHVGVVVQLHKESVFTGSTSQHKRTRFGGQFEWKMCLQWSFNGHSE